VSDVHDEGGDPACWLHLFEDVEEDDPGAEGPSSTEEGAAEGAAEG
jgi:hypothetical protein